LALNIKQNGETMRHLITLTVFGLATTLTACGSLSLSDGIGNVFTYETNLDDNQQLIVDNIETTFAVAADELLEPENSAAQGPQRRSENEARDMEQRRPHGIFHRGFPVDWMIDYIEGDLDASGVLASIQEKQAEMAEHIEQREADLLSLLASFGEEQAAQFLENLDNRHARIEERESGMERENRLEPEDMFGELNLSEAQQDIVEELVEGMGEDRLAGPEGQRELIEAFLNGEKTAEEVELAFETLRNERHQSHLNRVSDWLNFLDSLSEEQKATLLSTLEEIQNRHDERCAEMEENFGSPRERSE
jgi:hypothetical protein